MSNRTNQATQTEEVDDGPSFMDVWRTVSPLDHLLPSHPVWASYREDIFVDNQEIRDKQGNTLLMFALWGNKPGVGKALFELGCDPSAYNEKGFTVIQSLIREISTYKAARSPQYISNILEQIPCTWHHVDPDGKHFDKHTLDHVKVWTRNFLLMDMSFSKVDSADVERLVEFIATPLSYTHIKRLTDELRADSTNHEDMVFNHPSWQAQVAKKAAAALLEVVPQKVRDELLEDRPRSQPKI